MGFEGPQLLRADHAHAGHLVGHGPLADGVEQTIEHYQAAIDAGLVDVDRILA